MAETLQRSALLCLPPEIFQLIMVHMDADTFYASLLTCKYWLKAAESRPIIWQHLQNLPGFTLGLDGLSDSELLLRFRKRAAQAGCAAGIFANTTKYRQTSQRSLSNAAFSAVNMCCREGLSACIATVHVGSIIHVYDLGKHHVRLKAELHIRPEDGDDSEIEILKISFAHASRDLAVLCCHLPRQRKANHRVNAFGHISTKSIYKLVTFHYLWARTKGHFYDSHQQETRDIAVRSVEYPVGLTLAAEGHACIAWRDPSAKQSTNITLIGRDHKLMQACTYGQSKDMFSTLYDVLISEK